MSVRSADHERAAGIDSRLAEGWLVTALESAEGLCARDLAQAHPERQVEGGQRRVVFPRGFFAGCSAGGLVIRAGTKRRGSSSSKFGAAWGFSSGRE